MHPHRMNRDRFGKRVSPKPIEALLEQSPHGAAGKTFFH